MPLRRVAIRAARIHFTGGAPPPVARVGYRSVSRIQLVYELLPSAHVRYRELVKPKFVYELH